MTVPRALTAGVLLVFASATGASALSDVLMPCKTLNMRIDKHDANAVLFKLVCIPTSGTMPLPNVGNSPLENDLGASLWVRDLVSLRETAVLLPSPYWVGLGEPAGSQGYRFHDKSNIGCKSIRLEPERLKLNCKMVVASGLLPAAGDVGVLLHFYPELGGEKLDFCAQPGGTETRNDESVLKRWDAPAPAACLTP